MNEKTLIWLRERGDKWNERRGPRRIASLLTSITWQVLATYTHPLARGERLSAVWELIRWWPHRHGQRQVVVQDMSGRIITAPAAIGVKHASLGLFQLPEKTFILHITKPGDLMVDVGAYIGDFTVLMATCGAAVHAFEPVEASRDILAHNIRVNGLEHLVTIHALAVSDAVGQARITNQFASGNRLTSDEVFLEQSELVQVVTLDAWARGRELDRLIIVKIDAEGLDERVLAGADSLLHRYEPALIVEYWDGTASLENRLDQAGYQCYTYDFDSSRLLPFKAVGGAGNVIACTARGYENLSSRLAAAKVVPLKRPRISWASPASGQFVFDVVSRGVGPTRACLTS